MGIADDFLSTVVMAAANQAPIYIAPAMNTNMYENPIVQENIEKLKSLGYQFIEPKESMLACGTLGKGALADVECDRRYSGREYEVNDTVSEHERQ